MISKLFLFFIFAECFASLPSVEEASSLVKFGPDTLSQCQTFRESTEENSDGTTVNVIESNVQLINIYSEKSNSVFSIRTKTISSALKWSVMKTVRKSSSKSRTLQSKTKTPKTTTNTETE